MSEVSAESGALAEPLGRSGSPAWMVRLNWFLAVAVIVYLVARFAGDRYAAMAKGAYVDTCKARLGRVSAAIREYHRLHPEEAFSSITPEKLTPALVPDRNDFLCPAVRTRAGAGRVPTSFMWSTGSSDWAYVHRRRGDEIPLLICTNHRAEKGMGGLVHVARLNGATERMEAPLGVSSEEW